MSHDRATLLYGSQARGDADEISDVDVLVVGDEIPQVHVIEALLHSEWRGPLRVSHYRWEELNAMMKYGSLLLHHVVAESRPLLFEGHARCRLSELLSSLGPYRLAVRDLCAFRITLSDVREGLAAGLPPRFELAVIGGVARHASVLACYAAGRPTFGRHSIQRAAELLAFPEAGDLLRRAHLFRLCEEGQCEAPAELVTRAEVYGILGVLSEFLDRLEEVIDADAA